MDERARVFRFVTGAAMLIFSVAWLYHRDAPLRAGVAFQHVASIRELARGEFPPRHNLIAGYAPQGHYGPYFVALGWAARWSGASPQTVLDVAGVLGALAFVLALGGVTLRVAGPEAASWSPWCGALLWGPWPGRTIDWEAWGWPGTTSPADAQNFFYPQHAALVLMLVVVALLLRRDPTRVRDWGLALVLSALLVATHALTGVALGIATVSMAATAHVERRATRARTAALLALPALGLALAALWPYYPVLGLLDAFANPGVRQSTAALSAAPGLVSVPAAVSSSPDVLAPVPAPPPTPFISLLGPAVFGLAAAIVLARRRQPYLLIWSTLSLAAVFCPLLPLRQRLVTFAAIPLQIALAALLGDGRRGKRVLLLGLLVAGALSAAVRIRWLLHQEPLDLAFVGALVPEDGIVLGDPRTSNAVAGLTGRKIVAPEGPDMFLVLAGGWQRTLDVERFLGADAGPDERRTILDRWNVTHVLVDQLGEGGPDLPFPIVYDGGGFVLYDVRGR